MECVKMYYVIVFTLLTWAVTSSEAVLSTQFKGIAPNPVLLGFNVTFSWTYTAGQDDKLRLIYFNFVDEQKVRKKIASYIFTTGKTGIFPKFAGYFDSVEWVGNITRKVAAFQMNNISNLAHDQTFGVEFYRGYSSPPVFDDEKIFISVPPKVNLIITKTNVTVGETVTIQCEVIQGRPTPTISWYQNGTIVEQTGIYLINNEEIQEKNAGSYKCKATNNAGSSVSKVIMITVHKKSGNQNNDINECKSKSQCSINAECFNTIGSYTCKCKEGFYGNGKICKEILTTTVQTTLGRTVILVCTLNETHVIWRKDGSEVKGSKKLIIFKNLLVVKEVSQEDLGEYLCDIKTNMNATISITLETVRDPVQIPFEYLIPLSILAILFLVSIMVNAYFICFGQRKLLAIESDRVNGGRDNEGKIEMVEGKPKGENTQEDDTYTDLTTERGTASIYQSLVKKSGSVAASAGAGGKVGGDRYVSGSD